MYIYDGQSPINWFYDGMMTPKEMKRIPRFKPLFKEPCVLMDNGAGRVYKYKTLSYLKSKYGITTEDPEDALKEVTVAAQKAWRKPDPKKMESDISDLGDELDITSEATLEAGEIATNASQDLETTQEAVFELAETVDGQGTNQDISDEALFDLATQIEELKATVEELQSTLLA